LLPETEGVKVAEKVLSAAEVVKGALVVVVVGDGFRSRSK
jgi:hypothetical protein